MNVARDPSGLPPARRSVAVGTFDGVHRGHLQVIDAARTAGLRTAVLTFDPHPRTVLGGSVELLATLERRLELLADAGVEDVLVLPFDAELAALPAEEFAERMLRGIGADVVGMSTVPEVIVAVHQGMRVLGISIVTDQCLPDALEPADIGRIIATAAEAEPRLTQLLATVVERLA